MRRIHLLCFAVALLVPTAAMADSIDPSSQTWFADPGDVITVQKTITIDQRIAGNLDVFFLFDATSSMGTLLQKTSSAAAEIVDGLVSAYGAGNLGIGVGLYEDIPVSPFGIPGGLGGPDSPWTLVQAITTDVVDLPGDPSDATLALQSLPSTPMGGGGEDLAESQFWALTQAADLAGWRPGASRVIVWIGDSPGWDAAVAPEYAAEYTALYGSPAPTLAEVIDALGTANVIVEAVSVGTGFEPGVPNLDASFTFPDYNTVYPGAGVPTTGPGQATAIGVGTGGSLRDLGAASAIDSDDIIDSILAAVEASFLRYNEVGLDVSVPALLGYDIVVEYRQHDPSDTNPYDNAPFTGDWTREATRTFVFDVRILVGGTDDILYEFEIYGTLDGGRILTENDTLIVGDRPDDPDPVIPEPSTVALMGFGLLGLGYVARRKLRK